MLPLQTEEVCFLVHFFFLFKSDCPQSDKPRDFTLLSSLNGTISSCLVLVWSGSLTFALQWNWNCQGESGQICGFSLAFLHSLPHSLKLQCWIKSPWIPNGSPFLFIWSLLLFLCFSWRILERHSIWPEALLQTVHQALQWGSALGMCHPEDHWYKGTGRNTNAAPHSRYWGESHSKQFLSLEVERLPLRGTCSLFWTLPGMGGGEFTVIEYPEI